MRTRNIQFYSGSISDNEIEGTISQSKIIGAWEIDPADSGSIQFRIHATV